MPKRNAKPQTSEGYYRPTTLAEALELLRRPDLAAIPLAGGGEAITGRVRGRALASQPQVPAVIDLSALGLDFIELSEDELRLGPMVTLQALVESSEVQGVAGGLMSRAAGLTAPRQVRNQATLGGTLLGESAAHADLACALLALNADLVIAPEVEQREAVPLETFYTGGHLERELLVEVVIACPPPGPRSALHRIGRTPADQPLLEVAGVGRCQDGRIEMIHLAASGAGPRPVRLRGVEQALQGVPVNSEAFEAAVRLAPEGLTLPDDFRASAEYRAAMLPVLVTRVLHDLCPQD
ncbi:MAG TPA: hypothetical protein DEP84_37330 [Chloroflexi bacterium]|nr:hypothetical protein [Chloroflexota bacterium]